MQCDILDWSLEQQQQKDIDGKTGNLKKVWIWVIYTNVDIGIGWVRVYGNSVLYLQLFC